MEVLNALINEADRRGQLHPLPGNVRTSVYADDLVIFIAQHTLDFSYIWQILQLFAGTSGFSTNFDKCSITPIRCSDEQIQEVLQVFPCRLQNFPLKYLGAPLSVTRLPRDSEQALVDSVAARILGWKGALLTSAGRTVLAQTTLSAIPVHVSIICTLSPWAISEIDRRRRAFVWAGTDKMSGDRCRVAWPVVCSPREVGGLGLPDLRFLGFPLRLRWEWLRCSDVHAPWALLPCRAEKCVEAMFNASVTVLCRLAMTNELCSG